MAATPPSELNLPSVSRIHCAGCGATWAMDDPAALEPCPHCGRADPAPHTPGPWKWLDYPDGRKLLTGENNAVIHCPDAPIAVSEADQLLIRLAPDLLAVCRLVARLQHTTEPVGGVKPVNDLALHPEASAALLAVLAQFREPHIA